VRWKVAKRREEGEAARILSHGREEVKTTEWRTRFHQTRMLWPTASFFVSILLVAISVNSPTSSQSLSEGRCDELQNLKLQMRCLRLLLASIKFRVWRGTALRCVTAAYRTRATRGRLAVCSKWATFKADGIQCHTSKRRGASVALASKTREWTAFGTDLINSTARAEQYTSRTPHPAHDAGQLTVQSGGSRGSAAAGT
jgi:hypothetical protein